jgi:glucosamine--fructose-6-phosphate aminotransferase (isomerizing)
MCGIVGYIGHRNAVPLLLEGLRRLEYRGYDSAGIAFLENGNVVLRKTLGKLKNLESMIENSFYESHVGIGHTRWATHGKPSDINSHPHSDCTGKIAVVHNGIIENYSVIKKSLIADGHTLLSETDTEVIAHLIERKLKDGNLLKAITSALREIKGTYALAIMSSAEPDKIIAARRGSPLVIGKGNGEYIIASDLPAILTCTNDAIFVNENELVILDRINGLKIVNLENGYDREQNIYKIPWDSELAEKSGYEHFMLKEIHEQSQAARNTYSGKINLDDGRIQWDEINLTVEEINNISKIHLVSCGTSWHASLVGKFIIEKIAKIPVEVDLASEFRYRDVILDKNVLTIGITQSGETADTLEAMRKAKKVCFKVLSICNVVGSTATRESGGVIYTHAGPEIGVASTKAFTSQIVALYLFALYLGKIRGLMSMIQFREMMDELAAIPEKINHVLAKEREIEHLANLYWKKKSFFFLGRGIMYPIALEGALKLKELSYLHAEGYAGGEMKHGPIALVDRKMVVVSLIPLNSIYEKMLSNIEEVKARDGRVIAISSQGDNEIKDKVDNVFYIPNTNEQLSPLLFTIPLQLFAYHIAKKRGCDIDQPRNLAKSVTVE